MVAKEGFQRVSMSTWNRVLTQNNNDDGIFHLELGHGVPLNWIKHSPTYTVYLGAVVSNPKTREQRG